MAKFCETMRPNNTNDKNAVKDTREQILHCLRVF